MILDIHPVYWIDHAEYPFIILLLVIAMSLIKKIQIQPQWLIIPDAMGMALFAVSTAQMAHQFGHPAIIVAILSTMVSSCGGIIRDSLCQEIPMVFKKGATMYASLAFFGAYLYIGLSDLAVFSDAINMVATAGAIFASRLLAYKFQWRWEI